MKLIVERAAGRWFGTLTVDSTRVHAHGRTLKEVARCAQGALDIVPGADAAGVEVTPSSPELTVLAQARTEYEGALREAVRQLRARGASWADVAKATGVSQGRARAALTKPVEADGATE
ncbi:hypothetical protein [Nocardiopsis sp. CNS-639]|uniref:hypothetical protein n=1 Tax=Nocardiopsis sp. CNS-639 TaxID=1169153 RepID=UPI00036C5DD0|nr:hypothetical protein [Nocardiopsis sp. CNS-639]